MRWDPPVSRRLSELLAAASAGTLAAFDADGTLWSRDVGEAFLRHAGETGLLRAWPKGDAVWKEYEHRLSGGDLVHAFEMCATAFEGVPQAEVEAAARAFVDPQWNAYVFPPMRQLVEALHRAEAEVWVVSASPSWVVVPGAALLGIPAERVIATRAAVEGGVVQPRLAEAMPAFDRKAEAIVAAAGRAPHFAAGNSEYDFALLESARVLALLVDPPEGFGWLTRKNGPAWLVQKLEKAAPAVASPGAVSAAARKGSAE